MTLSLVDANVKLESDGAPSLREVVAATEVIKAEAERPTGRLVNEQDQIAYLRGRKGSEWARVLGSALRKAGSRDRDSALETLRFWSEVDEVEAEVWGIERRVMELFGDPTLREAARQISQFGRLSIWGGVVSDIARGLDLDSVRDIDGWICLEQGQTMEALAVGLEVERLGLRVELKKDENEPAHHLLIYNQDGQEVFDIKDAGFEAARLRRLGRSAGVEISEHDDLAVVLRYGCAYLDQMRVVAIDVRDGLRLEVATTAPFIAGSSGSDVSLLNTEGLKFINFDLWQSLVRGGQKAEAGWVWEKMVMQLAYLPKRWAKGLSFSETGMVDGVLLDNVLIGMMATGQGEIPDGFYDQYFANLVKALKGGRMPEAIAEVLEQGILDLASSTLRQGYGREISYTSRYFPFIRNGLGQAAVVQEAVFSLLVNDEYSESGTIYYGDVRPGSLTEFLAVLVGLEELSHDEMLLAAGDFTEKIPGQLFNREVFLRAAMDFREAFIRSGLTHSDLTESSVTRERAGLDEMYLERYRRLEKVISEVKSTQSWKEFHPNQPSTKKASP